METHFIEAAGNPMNWGKFMLGRFTSEEWTRRSALPGYEGTALMAGRGWEPRHILVLDLQTGEGFITRPGGSASADLNKHGVWVCPLFEPFLEWLYTQDCSDFSKLPHYVDLPEAPSAMAGYRRSADPLALDTLGPLATRTWPG